ncbi:MAG: 3-oxoacyl-ACP synthase [Bacteroidetes bacterium]|jgi:hypothetical protein|nr:3-oxoacyl-ACP synthase [Bacteroidota bacterium]MBT7142184.1 3-oxoacyl-ACP synthase [Bacteroidota bacterium]
MNKRYIQKHIKLVNNTVFINLEKIFLVNKNELFSNFAKSVYKNYEIKYRKFYKMDALSKLGFLSAEILLQDINLDEFSPEDIAIICANSSSSLHTDKNYQKTISEIPSPSVFVYTLPNIVTGEICIKNNIKGESLFFIQEKFDIQFIYKYVDSLFENTSTKLCITGWIELNANEEYQADLYLISTSKTDLEFNETNLNKTHNS